MSVKKIVVLTPVKNDAWILERFLRVTSEFADAIIVADQRSTDGSGEIAGRFQRVLLIENDEGDFDNASRQLLLIERARKEWGKSNLLLALDADEILAADALQSEGWAAFRELTAGTVIAFEKPDLIGGADRCIRYEKHFPMAYVDDGAEHIPDAVHSVRIPYPTSASRIDVDDVKVVHYAFTRPLVQAAKMRMYSIRENLGGEWSPFRRRRIYPARNDYTKRGRVGPAKEEWFQGWENRGIDMRTVEDEEISWYDLEALRRFASFGCRRFWLDDIWTIDWEKRRRYFLDAGLDGIPHEPVRYPPASYRMWAGVIDLVDKAAGRTAS